MHQVVTEKAQLALKDSVGIAQLVLSTREQAHLQTREDTPAWERHLHQISFQAHLSTLPRQWLTDSESWMWLLTHLSISVGDRLSLKSIVPHRLLKPISLAHGVLNVSTLAMADLHPRDSEMQRNDILDVEMGNNSGDELDDNAGLCLLSVTTILLTKRTKNLRGLQYTRCWMKENILTVHCHLILYW
jgi:hypothetical protein